ncbi:MAG TPA: SRPBCC domain-containing protein [Longimicrobium sp.]
MDCETTPAQGQPEPTAPEHKPFVVEVSIDAPPDAVWRAVSDPAEIRRWFGWDSPGLDEEVRYIFIDHATQVPPQRLEMGLHTMEIVPDGARTKVRVVAPGDLADARWDDVYDAMEEGWRTFFHQLKYYLERRAGQDRRTVYLSGQVPGPAVVAALEAAAPGVEWQASRHQRAVVPSAAGVDLVSVVSPRPLASDEPARLNVTVTTYGLDDDAFAAVQRAWTERWAALAPGGKVTV